MNHTWLSTTALLGRCERAYIQVAKLAGWVLVPAVAIMLASVSGFAAEPLGDKPKYICPPCYHVTDILETEDYLHDGNCPVCGMRLIE